MVCYEYLNLKDHKKNYVVHDLELAAVVHDLELEVVVHALKMWCHYQLGKKFILLTYNTCINILLTQLGLNVRKTRWMAFFIELTSK